MVAPTTGLELRVLIHHSLESLRWEGDLVLLIT